MILRALSRHRLSIRQLLLLLICLILIVSCAPTGIYHTVQPGQTLYRIAKTYEVDEWELARINRIGDPTALKASQRLFIPGATQLRNVPVTVSTRAVSPTPPVRAVSPAPPPVTKTNNKPAAAKPGASAPKPAIGATVAVTKPSKGLFVWPARGKVLNRFGKNGQKTYKGIEISLPAGTSVVAAAAGKVIFSGNAIRGYGNLVILEHSDGFFTVYGYNQKNLVSLDDFVGQGDRIALSGAPPDNQSPRLHFEIRQGKGAVDPIIYLP